MNVVIDDEEWCKNGLSASVFTKCLVFFGCRLLVIEWCRWYVDEHCISFHLEQEHKCGVKKINGKKTRVKYKTQSAQPGKKWKPERAYQLRNIWKLIRHTKKVSLKEKQHINRRLENLRTYKCFTPAVVCPFSVYYFAQIC